MSDDDIIRHALDVKCTEEKNKQEDHKDLTSEEMDNVQENITIDVFINIDFEPSTNVFLSETDFSDILHLLKNKNEKNGAKKKKMTY